MNQWITLRPKSTINVMSTSLTCTSCGLPDTPPEVTELFSVAQEPDSIDIDIVANSVANSDLISNLPVYLEPLTP